MSDQQTDLAASSAVQDAPAVPEVDVNRGPLVTWTREERDEYRKTGKPPEPPKPAATAGDADPDDSADSAATTTQEPEQGRAGKRRPDIEARFKRYSDEIDQLKAKLDEALKAKPTQAESSPAKPAEQAKPQAQHTRPEPTIEDKNPDGSAKY